MGESNAEHHSVSSSERIGSGTCSVYTVHENGLFNKQESLLMLSNVYPDFTVKVGFMIVALDEWVLFNNK